MILDVALWGCQKKMLFNCKECDQSFSTERSLHAHLKVHDLFVADYYCKYFTRKDLLTGAPLQFKQKDEYFSSYFSCRENMMDWLYVADEFEVKRVIGKMLIDRVSQKKLSVAPNEVELFFANLPPIKEYKRVFGSYTRACQLAGVSPMFCDKLPKEWSYNFSTKKIFIDTREQKKLIFSNSELMKLDVGDYSVGGEDFKNTFVDRKSFEKEILRAQKQDCYLWVVIEAPLESIFSLAKSSHHKPNISYISHNMRTLQHKYKSCLQFLFSGSRENSQLIIPKLLCLGDKLWKTDVQHFIQL